MPTELPGFQTPDSPKSASRAFVRLGRRIELLIADNVPFEEPVQDFDIRIEKALGNQSELLATGDSAQIVTLPGIRQGTKSYWMVIATDELVFLRGTYRIRVLVDDTVVYRKSLTVGVDMGDEDYGMDMGAEFKRRQKSISPLPGEQRETFRRLGENGNVRIREDGTYCILE